MRICSACCDLQRRTDLRYRERYVELVDGVRGQRVEDGVDHRQCRVDRIRLPDTLGSDRAELGRRYGTEYSIGALASN